MYRKELSFIVFLLFGTTIILNTTAIISASSYGRNGNETDLVSLLSFKSMITNDPYGVLTSWNTSFHLCDWQGIECGKRHRRVTVIDLRSQGLAGSLSPHVGNLTFLRELVLENNTFQGNIPHELGRLLRLQLLDLEFNKFDGVIPTNLSRCINLIRLRLSNNNLIGQIPIEVSRLSRLAFLHLNTNNLTGGIPHFIGNLSSLDIFSAVENPFGGSIPDSLGRLKRLTAISFGDCRLSGTIPHSIYNLSRLTIISFAINQLSGSLPPTVGAMLPQLKILQLWSNQLTGPLPLSISNLSNLELLELQRNKFNGMVKIDFSGLKSIKNLRLFRNNLGSGQSGEMKFLDSLANCSKLQTLSLGTNIFKGVLPNSIGNLSNHLSILGLRVNQLYGSLPSAIGNLVGMTGLYLEENKFTGKIPQTIGRLQKLQSLSLSGNSFSGAIPDSIGNLSMIVTLYLYSNMLEGTIPLSLGNCQKLLLLQLSQNKLTGNIPKQIPQLSSLSISLNLSHNKLSGPLSSEVARLNHLKALDLSDNRLTGIIPSDLSQCTSLEELYLQGNLFQGTIPPSLSLLRGISNLDLSRNNISGYIPQFLEQFLLQYLNLSLNDFEGKVPVKGVFANASAVSVFGNSRLCGGLPELGLPKCKETRKSKIQHHVLVIGISLSCAFLSMCICGCILWVSVLSFHKKKNKGQESQSPSEDRFLKVSYEKLLRATNGFSDSNLVGVGGSSSVYKGILDDGSIVAVKVLRLQNALAYKSFIAECEAWRNIRHRNLLKLITSCSTVDFKGNDFKAFVYEFMPNGSLDSWLHSPKMPRLSLLQRISILMDVASALDYLHNHCQKPIVHCDLKPSNILLDDEMIAHVGDFGLAKFLQADSSYTSSIGVRGTIGYTAPEYGLGNETTTNGDVYSFGILVLEMMTGKRPTDNMFNKGLDLHNFASKALPDSVTNIVDRLLLTFDKEEAIGTNGMKISLQNAKECVVSMVRIGVACSLESPQHRMNIADVVHELQYNLGRMHTLICPC